MTKKKTQAAGPERTVARSKAPAPRPGAHKAGAEAIDWRTLTLDELASKMPRQRWLYALAYDRLASQVGAYREVYNVTRDKDSWVRQEAWKVHKDPRVQAVLAQLAMERVAMHQDVQGRMVERLRAIVFATLPDAMECDGTRMRVRAFEEMNELARMALKRVKIRRRKLGTGARAHVVENIEVELYDPIAAAEALIRLLGLDRIRIEHSVAPQVPRLEELTEAQLNHLLGN